MDLHLIQPTMTVNLHSELHKFCGHSRRLRQIFEETKKCFEDINFSGNFDGSKTRAVCLISLLVCFLSVLSIYNFCLHNPL